MSNTPMNTIKDLKERTDARHIAEHLFGGSGKPAGHGVIYGHPHIEQRTPSFTVYADGFYDHATGESGSVIDLVMLMTGYDLPTAAQYVEEFIGGSALAYHQQYSQPASKVETAAPAPHWQAAAADIVDSAAAYLFGSAPDAQAALAYLHDVRGLTDATIRAARLGYNPRLTATAISKADGKPAYLLPGIVIPWYIHDALVAVRTRRRIGNLADALHIAPDVDRDGNEPSKYTSLLGSTFTSAPYNGDRLTNASDVLIVEGEFDALLAQQHADQAGIQIAVITAGSASGSIDAATLSSAPCVILATDNDAPGQAARAKLTVALANANLFTATVPGGKDITDYLIEHAGQLADVLATAAPISKPAKTTPPTADKPLPPLPAPKHNPKRIELPDVPSAAKPYEPAPLTVLEARSALAAQLKTIIQADDSQAKATILDVPCGVGKTRALLAAISEAISANPDLKVAYLNINRYDQPDGEQWLKEHGVPELAKHSFWFRGRSDKPDRTVSGDFGSAYCKQPNEVIRVSQAGHDPHDLVCLHCDLYNRCEEKHYLSQIKLAKQKQLLIARHNHIRHAELLENRTLIIIDENITPVLLTEKIVFSIAALQRVDTFTIRTIPGDLEEEYLIKRSVMANAAMYAIGSVIAVALDSLPPPTNYPNPIDNVKLGGKWLFDRLTQAIGLDSIKQQLTTLTDFIDTENDRKQLLDVTDGQPLPGNVETLIYWMNREVTLYIQGKPFNSRLIPERLSSDPGQLVLYPMEQIAVGGSTRVIVADASPNYALYGAAFDAPIVPFKLDIEQRAHVCHITGSLNTRSALKLNQLTAPKKAASLSITTLDDDTIETSAMPSMDATDYLTDVKALERAKDLIADVVRKHGKSNTAIVSYKALIEKLLKPWAAAALGVGASSCFWFGGNRGKNAYAHLEAIVSIGTPFRPDYDVLRSAQLWLCNDSQAIDPARQRYRLPHTDGILSGYADPRVQAMFYHDVTAELMQSAERVRLNTSPTKRFLYALTDIPFTEQIDLVTTFERYTVQQKIKQLTLDLPDPVVTRAQIVDQLVREKVAAERVIQEETATVWQAMQNEGLGEIEMTFRKAGKGRPGAAFLKGRSEL